MWFCEPLKRLCRIFYLKEVKLGRKDKETFPGKGGFGFIAAENGREVFFHLFTLEVIDFGALEEGNSVESNLEKTPKAFEQ